MLFDDRVEAGRRLAEILKRFEGDPRVLVLALPRGGVPVGYEIATALGAPLDVFLVRKLGVPGHEELAMGAIASGGITVFNDDLLRALRISEDLLLSVARVEERELQRREVVYRQGRTAPDVVGRIVILVDDGLATGATMRAAVQALRMRGPLEIVVAAPIAAADACSTLGREADACVCAETPDPFYGVGAWYRDFSQTTDAEVVELLERAARRNGVPAD